MVGGGALVLSAFTAAAVIYNKRKSHSPRVASMELQEVVTDPRIDIISRLGYNALDVAQIVTDHRDLEFDGGRRPRIQEFAEACFAKKMAELDAARDQILGESPEQRAQIEDIILEFKEMESKKYNAFALLHESVEEELNKLTLEECRKAGIDIPDISVDKIIQFNLIGCRLDEARSVFYGIMDCHLPHIMAKTLGIRRREINPRDLSDADKEQFRLNAMEHFGSSVIIANSLSDALENQVIAPDVVDSVKMAAVVKYSEEAAKSHARNPGHTIERARAAATQEINDNSQAL